MADESDLPDQPPVVPVEDEAEPLPAHKDDLVALAIERGIASYKAWDMTVPELRKTLEA